MSADRSAGSADAASAASSSASAADSASGEGKSCGITADDVSNIQAAAEQGLLAELDARRSLLSRVIACATDNAAGLQSALNGISLKGLPADAVPGAAAIQSQLSGRLGEAVTYYGLELQKVGSAGIAGTQAIARETLAYRSSAYEPLADNVSNFELWVSSQALFAAAENRLNGIANLVSFFEQAGPNNDLQNDLASAQALMQSAKSGNRDAENALRGSLPPGQTRALIQESLQSLSGTYQKFFDIANVIQSLLPSGK